MECASREAQDSAFLIFFVSFVSLWCALTFFPRPYPISHMVKPGCIPRAIVFC